MHQRSATILYMLATLSSHGLIEMHNKFKDKARSNKKQRKNQKYSNAYWCKWPFGQLIFITETIVHVWFQVIRRVALNWPMSVKPLQQTDVMQVWQWICSFFQVIFFLSGIPSQVLYTFPIAHLYPTYCPHQQCWITLKIITMSSLCKAAISTGTVS